MIAVLLVLALWVAVPAQAQDCSANCTVNANTTVTVYTDLWPTATDYALEMNGANVSTGWSSTSGYVEFRFPQGFAPGAYSFRILDKANGSMVWQTDPNSLTVIDLCATLPLKFTVNRWPAQATGNRSFYYSTNYPASVSVDTRSNPYTAIAVDSRGCRVAVTR